MDVTVSENISRSRTYTVAGVDDVQEGIAAVQALTSTDREGAVPGVAISGHTDVTMEETGQNDTENYTGSVAVP